jgi:hypothetical protein
MMYGLHPVCTLRYILPAKRRARDLRSRTTGIVGGIPQSILLLNSSLGDFTFDPAVSICCARTYKVAPE